MYSKNNGSSVCPGTVLSVFCLLLYSAGFIRIELKFNDRDQRLVAVEEAISQLKQGMAETSNKGTVSRELFILDVKLLFLRIRSSLRFSYFLNILH